MGDAAKQALLNHARVNLWANPMVDTQAIFDLSCLTRLIGQYRRISISGVEIKFPTKDYYLAWSLTSLPSRWIGITQNIPDRVWVPITQVMNNTNASFMFYNSQGMYVSMAEMYIMKQYNGNLIICMKYNKDTPDLTNHLYFRTYSNAIVVTGIDVGQHKIGQVIARLVKGDDDRSALIQQRDAWLADGATAEQIMYFIDGGLVSPSKLSSVKVGSFVDIVWDDTIRARIEAPVDTARSFNSSLDSCIKYIIQRGKLQGRLDYFDDVDFFVHSTEVDYGQYYHRNRVENVRQLTHSDYAVPADVFNDYVNFDGNPLTRENSKMLLFVRDTLVHQKLTNVEARISTLYRLPMDDIVMELSSPVGQMNKWRAESLEKDPYVEVMRHPSRNLPIDKLVDAYGYHGIIGGIAMPYTRPEKGLTKVPELYYDGFVGCYVLDDTLHVNDYPANTTDINWGNNAPELINFYRGSIITSDFAVSLPSVVTVGDRSYRFYAREKGKSEWVHKTKDDNFYTVHDDGKISVIGDNVNWDMRIRYDDEVLVTSKEVTANLSLVEIPVDSDFNKWRHMDVYLGTKKLIPKLEYCYDGEKLYYTGCSLAQGDKAKFTVICSGDLIDGEVTNQHDEVGFIINGNVSHGKGRYLLDDRNPLINIAGDLKLKNEVHWDEAKLGSPSENGLPYSIECRFPNIGELAASKGGSDTLMKNTLAVDKALKDYLDFKYPITPNNKLNIAATPLAVCSVLMSIAYDKRFEILLGVSGLISMDMLKTRMAKYADLAKVDICNQVLDERFISVQPYPFNGKHVSTVSAQEYDFLDKVNHYYLKGKISINDYYFIAG